MQGATGLGMLRRIQVTHGWANYTVCIHGGRKVIEGRYMIGYPPWAGIGWRAEKGGAGIRRIAT